MLFATGDILRLTRGLVIHQVNCQGKTGYLAKAIRTRWPQHFGAYFETVRAQRFEGEALGKIAVSFADGMGVAHIFGQVHIGPHTDLAAVDRALGALTELLTDDPIIRQAKIFAPFKMGCGKGGGDWLKYSALLGKHLSSVTIIKNPNFA